MKRSSQVPRLVVAALVLMLAACVTRRGQHEIFTPTPHNIETRLLAAEQELRDRDPADAAEELTPLASAPLDAAQRGRYLLLMAEVALAEDQPLAALQTLPAAAPADNSDLARRAEQLRAQALFRIGDAVSATQVLVRRERLITDPAQLAENFELLWTGLHSTDLENASGLRLAHADKLTRGWVELALISRSVWPDPQARLSRLQEWRVQYPKHPAEERIASIGSAQILPRRAVENIALLLPLSGAFAATGEAVRDGFLSGYFQAGGRAVTARIYDTGSTSDTMLTAYRAALSDGAEFLVGPLRREDVMALADDGRPPVPVLALNYLDPGRTAPFNFFQWGLAPEDEARQAAERAVTLGQHRAVVLVPEGDWGARVQSAFRERLEALGGTVIAERAYASDARDYSEPIRALLSLDMSEERHRGLTATLGVKTEFEPRRRQDVDLVFIAARPDQAKLLGTQLRFHRSGDLPVYATASIHDGGAPAVDLNGLRFCDMPWMFQQEGPWASLRAQLSALFPRRGREYTRLLALGHDAYTLVNLIESGQLQPGSFFPAASGTLTLRADGVISRGLACVEISKGALKPLDAAGPLLR